MSLKSFKRSSLASAVAAVLALSSLTHTPQVQALPVFDAANLFEAIIQELNQLEQIAADEIAYIQQLKEYRLQLEALKQLPGNIRNDVKDHLKRQLLKNVRDYGKSIMNKTSTQSSDSSTYYVVAEDIVSAGMDSEAPRSLAKTSMDLVRLGMKPGKESGMGRDTHVDRMHFDRILDDLRQVAIARENSENRGQQANEIARQMAAMPDNNTVGAIQLLSAQNALAYAQNEDLIKAQTTLMKSQQEAEIRLLVEKEAARKRELARLTKIRTETQQTNVQMVP